MKSGFAVIGDTQFLPGYSVLLSDDPSANHLTDLDWPRRTQFLLDLALLGEAIEEVCKPRGLRRMNYEVLGNTLPVLHGHVWPRYEWEPPDILIGQAWRHPKEVRNAPENAYSDVKHGELRAAITAALTSLMRRALA
jgi:diadenosine tetraphosphate (Ap4A) HIT family hydrolase